MAVSKMEVRLVSSLCAENVQPLVDFACPLFSQALRDWDEDQKKEILVLSEGILPDSPTVLALPGRAVLRLSPALAPDVVRADQSRARAVKERLGLELGRPILDPILEGDVVGRSFVVLPWRQPLHPSRFYRPYQKLRYGIPVIRWLEAVASNKQEIATRETYESMLSVLHDLPDAPRELRDATNSASDRLDRCTARLVHIPMHGDLWMGNLLSAPLRQRWPFTLIDWGGSSARGFPFFDLLRLSDTFRFRARLTRSAVLSHCKILRCEPQDVRLHVAAVLGHIRVTQPGFHADRFFELSRRLFAQLTRLGL